MILANLKKFYKCAGIFIFLNVSIGFSQTVTWVDSCQSNSFISTFNTPPAYSFSNFRKVHPYLNGDVIAVGFCRPNLPTYSNYRVYGLITRVSGSGSLLWAKYVGDVLYDTEMDTRFYISLITPNNEIVVVGDSHIFRFNGNGDIIWQRPLPRISSSYMFQSIIQTSDGGFLLSANSEYQAVVLKLDNTGGVLWSRRFNYDSYINARSVIETATGYYFEGFSYQSWTSIPGSRNVLVKMDKSTGSTIWAKSLGAASSSAGGTEFAFDEMAFIDGKIVLTGNTNVNYRGPNRNCQVIVTLDESGSFFSAKRMVNQIIEVFPSSVSRSRLFDPFTNTGIQYSAENTNDLFIYRVTDQGVGVFSWKYPAFSHDMIYDMHVKNDLSLYLAGRTKGTNFFERALLISVPPTGKLGSCSEQTPNVIVADFNLQVEDINIGNSYTNFGAIIQTPLRIFDATGFNWQLSCEASSSCKLSKIEGVTTICKNQSGLYFVRRSSACTESVQFSSADPSVIIQPLSDTSANISFTYSGSFLVYSEMHSECGILRDSVLVSVKENMPNVSLGEDRFICNSNSFRLNAHTGYDSYVWQDGSTDSIFHVTFPGNYHVTATDFCGNISRDTVSVVSFVPPPFSAGPSRQKCNSDTLHLNASPGFLNYTWSPDYHVVSSSSATIIVNPPIDTVYYVEAENPLGCFVFDTVRIWVKNSRQIDLGIDTTFCIGSETTLHAGGGFLSYTWNTGETSDSISVSAPGKYHVAAANLNGCFSKDTILISNYPEPNPELGIDSVICSGRSRRLDLPGFISYLWNDGSTNRMIDIANPGVYWVEVKDSNQCAGTDTITINTIIYPPVSFLPGDMDICINETREIVSNTSFSNYSWSDYSTSSNLIITKPGLYWLEVKDQYSCTWRDSITVSTVPCKEFLYFPSAFSPNGDGKNDLFKPVFAGRLKSYKLSVLDRWGNVVFRSSNPYSGWDGKYRKMQTQISSFVWFATYQFEGKGEVLIKGTCVLMY